MRWSILEVLSFFDLITTSSTMHSVSESVKSEMCFEDVSDMFQRVRHALNHLQVGYGSKIEKNNTGSANVVIQQHTCSTQTIHCRTCNSRPSALFLAVLN